MTVVSFICAERPSTNIIICNLQFIFADRVSYLRALNTSFATISASLSIRVHGIKGVYNSILRISPFLLLGISQLKQESQLIAYLVHLRSFHDVVRRKNALIRFINEEKCAYLRRGQLIDGHVYVGQYVYIQYLVVLISIYVYMCLSLQPVFIIQ